MKYQIVKHSKIGDAQPSVSIIIPVFNVENYINQCVESIGAQTFKNFEIIIVDDCSNDGTLKILESLHNKYPNISIYKTDKPSGSPATGRNIGLQKAKGDYILFVDGDDWLDSNYLELLYNSIKKNNSDICFSNGFKNHLNSKQSQRYYKENYLDADDELRGFHESFMLWDKLFSRKFLVDNNLFISELQASEELNFIIKAYYLSKRSVVSKGNYGYNYRRLNDRSVTKSKRMVLYPDFEFKGWQQVDKWVAENNIPESYKNIILLRKILSFNYAISIVGLEHKDRFIKEVAEYIPLNSKGVIIPIAKKLGYESTVESFFELMSRYVEFQTQKGILFGPDWSKSNIYQKLLADAIKRKYFIYSTGFSPKQLNKSYLESKRSSCHVLHLHWLHSFYDVDNDLSIKEFIETVKFAKQLNYTLIVTIHNIFPHDVDETKVKKHWLVQQSIYDLADYLLVHSQTTKLAVMNKFNVNAEKVCITNHGLYPVKKTVNLQEKIKAKESLGYSSKDFVISCVGRIRAYKGTGVAISQFIKYTNDNGNNSKLIIAGHPDDEAVDTLILQSVKNHSNISYIRGSLSEEKLSEILLASDACLLPYIKGTTSGVAYLCMSYKLPMITSNLECFKEFSEGGFAIQMQPENIHIGLEFLTEVFYSNKLNEIFNKYDDKNLKYYHWDNIVESHPYNKIL